MPTVKLLKATTNLAIDKRQVPWFRGTLGNVAGSDFPLFHNHVKNGLRWKYPLVQYVSHNGRGTVIGINEGANQILKLFDSVDIGVVDIHGDSLGLSIKNLSLVEFKVRIWKDSLNYIITDYLPLNESTKIDYENSRLNNSLNEFMAKKLTGNILSFAKGIDWIVDENISVIVEEIEGPIKRRLKGLSFLAFKLRFSSNVSMPTGIGLGKGASMGFGRIISLNTESRNDK